MLDGSSSVRGQLLKLFKSLPARDIEDHVEQILPYVRAGMTHLAADIRLSSVEILAWLVEVAGNELVACAGGWIKTLKCFLAIFGWHTEESAKWSSNKASFGKAGSEGKPMIKSLTVLADFLRVGLVESDELDRIDSTPAAQWPYPLYNATQYLLPERSNCYGYLNLFGTPRDEESQMYEDVEDRKRVYDQNFALAIEKGLDAARKEGGETGRAAATVTKVLREASRITTND